MSTGSLTSQKSLVGDNTMTNISKTFTHKMAAKTGWHRYETKLRHCHPMYNVTRSRSVQLCYTLSRDNESILWTSPQENPLQFTAKPSGFPKLLDFPI